MIGVVIWKVELVLLSDRTEDWFWLLFLLLHVGPVDEDNSASGRIGDLKCTCEREMFSSTDVE